MNQLKSNKDTEPDRSPVDTMIIKSLARLDAIALGVSVGSILGLAIFAATNILVFKGGEAVGPRLMLLSQYFIGYQVTPVGSLVGLGYGFVTGFVLGWLGASLRNFLFKIYITYYKLKANMSGITDLIDNP